MTELSFASSEAALLRGATRLLVVAPKARFAARRFPKIFKDALRKRVVQMADKVAPRDLGASASSPADQGFDKLGVAVLPDALSRHNSPARGEPVRRGVKSFGTSSKGKTAIVIVCDEAAHVLAVCNAVARALPILTLKGGKVAKLSGRVQVLCVDPKGKALRADKIVQVTAESSREAARLVDRPPTELHPREFVREAKALLRGISGVRMREIAGDKLLEQGLGGIHGVGRCALEKPRLFIATYTPKSSRSAKHVALVGKGITYDTGGLDLKIGGFMSGMKGDMGGAAATLGAFRVLAKSGCKHKVSLLLCLAENAIGPAAVKPDDVLFMHSGKTVEINNTDAEGRLVLGDGVSWAARKLGCSVIFDAATLTGAQLIATGLLHAAIVSNEDELERTVLESGRAVGDLCHPLPFAPEFYKKEFASSIADMKNSVKNRKNAQSSCAAQFVYNHLDGTDVRWCHVDLAGPADIGERGSGFGVALLSEAVRRL